MLLEPLEKAVQGGLQVAPTLVERRPHEPNSVWIPALNLSNQQIAVSPTLKLGKFVPAEVEPLIHIEAAQCGQQDVSLTKELPAIDMSNFKGTAGQRGKLEALLINNSDVFLREGEDLGCTPTIQHHINTVDHIPVVQPYRRIPAPQWQEVKDHLKELMRKGIIKKSTSQYASPIVLVRKKGGALRICVDYRKLNLKVPREVFPLPRIDETLEALQGANYFSTLDLASVYNKVAVAPNDVPKTAFMTPMGSFEK